MTQEQLVELLDLSAISVCAVCGQAVAQSKRDETLWLHLPSGGCEWLFPPHRGVRERS